MQYLYQSSCRNQHLRCTKKVLAIAACSVLQEPQSHVDYVLIASCNASLTMQVVGPQKQHLLSQTQRRQNKPLHGPHQQRQLPQETPHQRQSLLHPQPPPMQTPLLQQTLPRQLLHHHKLASPSSYMIYIISMMLSLICYMAQSVYAMGSEKVCCFAKACCSDSLVTGCMFLAQA